MEWLKLIQLSDTGRILLPHAAFIGVTFVVSIQEMTHLLEPTHNQRFRTLMDV